mgnify:CR=1 FL=1
MEENRKNNSQGDSSSFNYLVAFLIVIIIVGTSLAITPLGDILSKELVNSELLEYSDQKSLSKKDNTKIKDENEKIVYTYTAKYNHLGTENNILLDGTVFFSFPMPMIENEPAVNLDSYNHKIENSTVQLLADYKENDENITQVQIKNKNYGKFIEPRQDAIFSEKPFLSNLENIGKKITVQSSGGGFTDAFRKEGHGGAIYEHERILINVKFSVPKEKTDEINLEDQKGNISSKVIGTTDGPNTDHTHIPIQYSVSVSLSREIENDQKVDKYIFEAEEPVPRDKSVELKKIT